MRGVQPGGVVMPGKFGKPEEEEGVTYLPLRQGAEGGGEVPPVDPPKGLRKEMITALALTRRATKKRNSERGKDGDGEKRDLHGKSCGEKNETKAPQKST